MAEERKLRKMAASEAWVGGVCAGVAYWLGVPVWIVRLIWAVLILGYGVGLFVYVLLWIFLPAWDCVPDDFKRRTGD
jgi:phage shock protein PspC (stress-responsive transcriptional regulator)